MKLVCVWTALIMSLPPAGGAGAQHAQRQTADMPAQESRTPATVIGSKEERVGKAAGFYEKGRFVEAALEFEGLVKDFPAEPNFLFNAAVSRYGAGHYAHTIAYTREYLAHPKLTPEDRKEAEAQLSEAQRKAVTTRVTVRAPAGSVGEVTVVAQHVARASSDIRPELLFPVKLAGQQAVVSLDLDPGAWTLRVEGSGYVRAERQVELTLGAANTLELTLALAARGTPTPNGPAARDVPASTARQMKLGLGVAGGIVAVAGVVVTGIGAGKVARRPAVTGCVDTDAALDDYAQCRSDWSAAYVLRDSGLSVLGAGTGLLIGGLTWLGRDARKRRSALLAEAVLGGLAAAAGLGLTVVSSSRFGEANRAPQWVDMQQKIEGAGAFHGASTFVVGLGVGTLVGAALGLGVQRKHVGSLRAGALTGPGQAGLVLSGSF